MIVFTTAYDTTYGDTLTDVFDSIDAVITKLQLMKLHGTFEECETFTIKCQEVTDNKEMLTRYNRVKEHYESK